MGTFEAIIPFISGTVPCLFRPDTELGKGPQTRCNRRKDKRLPQFINCLNAHKRGMVNQRFPMTGHTFYNSPIFNKSHQLICYCQQRESDNVAGSDNKSKTWYEDFIKGLYSVNDMLKVPNILEFWGVEQENGSDKTNDRAKDHMVEEAWELLRDSVVYYCAGPIGTIAAKPDASSSDILNYDQVFIRDFISSGLAFLLNGEYDIVRNFILYTLQLQVCKHLLSAT